MFTFKNWLKKVCLFGASASLACCFCSPLTNAAPDTNKGIQVDDNTITGYTLTLSKSNLIYNGSAQALVNAVTDFKYINNSGTSESLIEGTGIKNVKLYLRASTSQTATPTLNDWKEVSNISSLGIQGTDIGKYYIFYCVDSNGSDTYPDAGMNN